MAPVPRLSHMPLLHMIAFLDGHDFDASAEDGRQAGSSAGLDLAGARVGDRQFDPAAVDFLEHHGDWFGPVRPLLER